MEKINILNKIITLAFIISLLGCHPNTKAESFNVEIRDFDGAGGVVLHYKINNDSIRIHFDCDFQNCKDTIIYDIALNKKKATQFYQYLKKNSTDTLRSIYHEEGFDGLNLLVKISGDGLKAKTVKLERYFHPEIEKLIVEMDKLIPEKKYKYFRN